MGNFIYTLFLIFYLANLYLTSWSAFRITGFLDLVHHQELKILKRTTFWELDLFCPQVRGGRHLLCRVP
jgi:hypothetical protein